MNQEICGRATYKTAYIITALHKPGCSGGTLMSPVGRSSMNLSKVQTLGGFVKSIFSILLLWQNTDFTVK